MTAQHSQGLRLIESCIKILHAYLAESIELSLKMIRGAGGAAISGSLKVCGVVFSDSPAFDLLHLTTSGMPWCRPDTYTLEATRAILIGIVQRLDSLFREEKASPTDVDSYGNTLLHVSPSLPVSLSMTAAENLRGCC